MLTMCLPDKTDWFASPRRITRQFAITTVHNLQQVTANSNILAISDEDSAAATLPDTQIAAS